MKIPRHPLKLGDRVTCPAVDDIPGTVVETMSTATKKSTEKDEAIARLREWIQPGDTLTTILRHVSSSGMSRRIDVYKMSCKEGKVERQYLSWNIAKAIGWRVNDKHEGIVVSGCGMDMGFHVVYTLSRVLFPDGFECVGKGCHSNDHSNGDRDYTPHHHTDGGYALRQEWL